MSYVEHCDKHGQYHADFICRECFEAFEARVRELTEEKNRLRPCRGCPTVQCTCFSELEDELLNRVSELKDENARLKVAMDPAMREFLTDCDEVLRLRKVVDAARDYAKWGASIGPNARKDWAALTDSLRELDGEKSVMTKLPNESLKRLIED